MKKLLLVFGSCIALLFSAQAAPPKWVYLIHFDPLGHVQDNDADDINYDDLLAETQQDTEESSQARLKKGY